MDNLKSYDLMVENDLEIDDLPEKITSKVLMLEDLLDKYESDEDADMRDELKMRIESCDQGLYLDVVQYLKEHKKESEEGQSDNEKINPVQQTNQANQVLIEGKPSWRFWM